MALSGDEKMTHLNFYLHEIFFGPNATVSLSVKPPNVETSGATFGGIGVYDNMLRRGPEPDSELIGRAQGIAAQASSLGEGMVYTTTANYVFTEGEFRGSSIAIIARVTPGEKLQWSIVGGTGRFLMARGYINSTYLSTLPGPVILEMDAYIYHRAEEPAVGA